MAEYLKSYVSPHDLVNTHLINKGLGFSASFSQVQAEAFLSKVSWFRFKSYLFPYLNSATKLYNPGTTFFQGIELYYFDCELRELCNKYILRIEVKARSIFNEIVTNFTNDSFWYLNDDYFLNPEQEIYNERNKIVKHLKQSKTEFAEHYKQHYISPKNPFRKCPPFWMAVELMTFDSLLRIVDAMDQTKFNRGGKNYLDEVSTQIGAASFKELKSWLNALKELRNRCSHSNRTWNSNYRLPSGFVDNNNNLLVGSYLSIKPSMKNKVYTILAVVNIITNKLIIPANGFSDELKALLTRYRHIPNLEHSMGVPPNWRADPLWI